jgi:hypothetical protein
MMRVRLIEIATNNSPARAAAALAEATMKSDHPTITEASMDESLC